MRASAPARPSGGVWSYQESLEFLADPAHPEYAERRVWFEDDLTPEAFDLTGVNADLAETFKNL